MQPLPVVLLQSNPATAKCLVATLDKSFHLVRQAPSLNDLRSCLAKHPKGVAILDLEVASLFDVQTLSRDFPETKIICNHRLADEQMWTATLGAGATDCCPSNDAPGILRAALQHLPTRKAA